MAKTETFEPFFLSKNVGRLFLKNLCFFAEIVSFLLPKKRRECKIQYVGWSSDCEVSGISSRKAP